MKLTAHLLLPVFLVATANAAEVGLRIRLGLTDKSPTKWDGSIGVEPGRVAQITGWRFGAADEVRDAKSWTCSTRHQPPVGARKAGKRAGKAADAALGPMLENGVVVTLADVSENSRVEVKTAHGDFSFSIADVAFGAALPQLNGAASVDRVASGVQLTKDRADDDFPAAAVANDGTIYLAYISFTPGLDRDKRARALDAEIKDFSELAKPAGGDQLWLRTMKNGRWTEPVAVTAGKGDLFKCAVAVDGGGCAWVFWSENKDGNFD
ncbi:MAG: hypothetical protein FJ388_26760, partial [Verrucomicrobia bacterium]|nr:hypothetical protein [Verrucomicrobiota bacterium]